MLTSILLSLSLSLSQDQIPDHEVKNLTSDWNDGTLIAALVDALAPGLCPEHAIMDPKNAQQNASQAMKLAEDWLDVPQVGSYSSTLKRVDNIICERGIKFGVLKVVYQ